MNGWGELRSCRDFESLCLLPIWGLKVLIHIYSPWVIIHGLHQPRGSLSFGFGCDKPFLKRGLNRHSICPYKKYGTHILIERTKVTKHIWTKHDPKTFRQCSCCDFSLSQKGEPFCIWKIDPIRLQLVRDDPKIKEDGNMVVSRETYGNLIGVKVLICAQAQVRTTDKKQFKFQKTQWILNNSCVPLPNLGIHSCQQNGLTPTDQRFLAQWWPATCRASFEEHLKHELAMGPRQFSASIGHSFQVARKVETQSAGSENDEGCVRPQKGGGVKESHVFMESNGAGTQNSGVGSLKSEKQSMFHKHRKW